MSNGAQQRRVSPPADASAAVRICDLCTMSWECSCCVTRSSKRADILRFLDPQSPQRPQQLPQLLHPKFLQLAQQVYLGPRRQAYLLLLYSVLPCVPFDVLVNAGGTAIVPYCADDPSLVFGIHCNFFTTTVPVDLSGANTAASVYNSERWMQSPGKLLTFTIPVTVAVTVETHHAETVFGAFNVRVMGVSVNGVVKIANLDVFRQVGQNVALVNTFLNEVSSGGSITISFTRQTQNPQVNAIRVFRT